ncbi:MAG: tetratricopeptide repeat protein [Candidatus Hodarchaeota archaeon]
MTSPYIQNIKDWKIRELVIGFLEAKATFEKNNKPKKKDSFISFSILRKICDMLYETKENHHLIFKKITNPKNHTFEVANKFTPNEGDINFMNNVGLLFHKVMVARELKYVLDYYEEDSTGYQETKASLERNLQRIEMLFNQGIDILLSMLRNHKNNIYLITYFLENKKFCTDQFRIDLESLLKIVTDKDSLENTYLMSAMYYANSGWYDKARKMSQKSLQLNPENKEAKSLIESIK